MRIAVLRTDRLGDTLLALPSLAYLRKQLPSEPIDFFCRKRHWPCLKGWCAQHKITLTEPNSFASAARSYEACLILHAPARTYFTAWRSGIPLRVGMRSQPASWIFLTDGIRQRRSHGTLHEGEYNLELAYRLGARLGLSTDEAGEPILLPEEPSARKHAEALLHRLNVRENEFTLLHPGTGGTAVNLSADSYIQILRAIPGPKILSQGPSVIDEELVKAITAREAVETIRGLPLDVFMEVCRLARVAIAPSTGPLHLAHYVGTRTLGLYAPLRPQLPTRWRPWGGNSTSAVRTPEVQCPAKTACLGARCQEYPCMDKTDWITWIRAHL